MGLFTNLNLNGSAPTRVQPKVGDWGPAQVPTTRHKRMMRVLAWVAFIAMMVVVVLFGWWVWSQMKAAGAA